VIARLPCAIPGPASAPAAAPASESRVKVTAAMCRWTLRHPRRGLEDQ
jgi:hypothetical protein